MKLYSLQSFGRTFLWIGIPSIIFSIIYFNWIGHDLIDYSQILACFVAIISLFLFSKTVLIRKQQYTIDFISQVYKDDMGRVFSTLRKAFADEEFDLSKKNIEKLLSYMDKNDNLEATVTKMLNFLEAFSLFINQGLLEESISKKLMRGVVIKNYQKLKFYIDYEQQKNGPIVFCEYVKLAEKWIKQEKK